MSSSINQRFHDSFHAAHIPIGPVCNERHNPSATVHKAHISVPRRRKALRILEHDASRQYISGGFARQQPRQYLSCWADPPTFY